MEEFSKFSIRCNKCGGFRCEVTAPEQDNIYIRCLDCGNAVDVDWYSNHADCGEEVRK